jgi:hypothetical protein
VLGSTPCAYPLRLLLAVAPCHPAAWPRTEGPPSGALRAFGSLPLVNVRSTFKLEWRLRVFIFNACIYRDY